MCPSAVSSGVYKSPLNQLDRGEREATELPEIALFLQDVEKITAETEAGEGGLCYRGGGCGRAGDRMKLEKAGEL